MGRRLTDADAPAWLGGSFIAAGVLIVLIAGGVVPVDPDAIKAPRWMLGAAGGVLAVAGARIVTSRVQSARRRLLGILMVTLLGVMCVWAAFGSSDPSATIGTGAGPVGVFAPAPPGVGRLLFAVGALMLLGALCLMLYRYFAGSR